MAALVVSLTIAMVCCGLHLEAAQRPPGAGPGAPKMGPRKTVLQILTDEALWGKNFRVLLTQLEGFRQAGERQRVVFPDRIIGGRAYKTAAEAQSGVQQLSDSLTELRLKPTSLSQKLASRTGAVPVELKAQAQYFADDESMRVTVEMPGLLAPGLTVETVKQRLGPPDRVTTELIQTEGERRPVVLTLYRYGGGAVVFAESDMAARPGFVNRALIDVPAATAALARDVGP